MLACQFLIAPQDQRLAALWPAVARRRLVTGFDLVLAPAWSVYDDDPGLLVTWNQIPSGAPGLRLHLRERGTARDSSLLTAPRRLRLPPDPDYGGLCQ